MTLNKSGRVIDLERLKNSLKELDSPLFNRFEFELIPKREYEYNDYFKNAEWFLLVIFEINYVKRLSVPVEIFIKSASPTYEILAEQIRNRVEWTLKDWLGQRVN